MPWCIDMIKGRITVKELCVAALLLAIALVLGYLESLFPPPVAAIPGAKLGLANICVLLAIYALNPVCAWGIVVLKPVLSALFTASVSAVLYSLTGGILAALAMTLLHKNKRFSVVGVSIAGAICFNIGQMLVAVCLLSMRVAPLLPWLLLLSIPAGLIVGICVKFCMQYLPTKLLAKKAKNEYIK